MGEERCNLAIVCEGFGWGCLSPRELLSIKLVDPVFKRPWCVEIGDLCGYKPVGIFDFFGDGRYIQSFVLIFGENFARLKVSRIVVICARTGSWRDVTVRVGSELLELKPHWWGDVFNASSTS